MTNRTGAQRSADFHTRVKEGGRFLTKILLSAEARKVLEQYKNAGWSHREAIEAAVMLLGEPEFRARREPLRPRGKKKERHGQSGVGGAQGAYSVWRGMLSRCYNKNSKAYKWYGGRGISVCDKWRLSFSAFFSDMGERTPGTSLDRIDNDGNYCKENCRWATKEQQSKNTSSVKLIFFNGESMGISAWARRLGMNKGTLSNRLRKWPLEDAMSVPLMNSGNKSR